MKPRVLVVEDDPVSQAFFLAVLAGLPAVVDAAARCGEAVACARDHPHALWLVDAHLPDGSAVGLLPRLRSARGSTHVVALAHTASRDPGVHAALLGGGFADVLAKPVGASDLLATVRRHLRMQVREPRAPFASATPPPGDTRHAPTGPWDDAAALAAVGDVANAQSLRAMLASELPCVVAKVDAALHAGDAATARNVLHRLASACAFTGAHQLGDAVCRLHRDPSDAVAVAAFREAAAHVLAPPANL